MSTVIYANSAEEIKSAIEQKVADGKTTIRLNLAPNAGTDEFMAIREAIKGAAPNDLGTIELTIIGVETIPEGLTPKLGRSISCPAIISPALHGKRQGSICHDEKVAYRPLIIW